MARRPEANLIEPRSGLQQTAANRTVNTEHALRTFAYSLRKKNERRKKGRTARDKPLVINEI